MEYVLQGGHCVVVQTTNREHQEQRLQIPGDSLKCSQGTPRTVSPCSVCHRIGAVQWYKLPTWDTKNSVLM